MSRLPSDAYLELLSICDEPNDQLRSGRLLRFAMKEAIVRCGLKRERVVFIVESFSELFESSEQSAEERALTTLYMAFSKCVSSGVSIDRVVEKARYFEKRLGDLEASTVDCAVSREKN